MRLVSTNSATKAGTSCVDRGIPTSTSRPARRCAFPSWSAVSTVSASSGAGMVRNCAQRSSRAATNFSTPLPKAAVIRVSRQSGRISRCPDCFASADDRWRRGTERRQGSARPGGVVNPAHVRIGASEVVAVAARAPSTCRMPSHSANTIRSPGRRRCREFRESFSGARVAGQDVRQPASIAEDVPRPRVMSEIVGRSQPWPVDNVPPFDGVYKRSFLRRMGGLPSQCASRAQNPSQNCRNPVMF